MTALPEDQFSISDKAFDPAASRRHNLEAIRKAGFTHLHFSYQWREENPIAPDDLADWKSDLNATGIQVLDVHGCHPVGMRYNLWSDTAQARQVALDLARHRLQVTHELGGDAMVYHVPCHVEPSSELYQHFLDGLAALEPLATDLGVSIALENHYELHHDKKAFTQAFAAFSPQFIGFTFDPGHAKISGNTDWLAEHCRKRLHILHLNDNNGSSDLHWNPFFPKGTVHWQKVIEAIAQSPYHKPIQLEVLWHKKEHASHADFLDQAHQAAQRIAAEVNRIRTTT